MISNGRRLAGIDVACKYSFVDSINIGDLTWQYPSDAYFPLKERVDPEKLHAGVMAGAKHGILCERGIAAAYLDNGFVNQAV